MRIHQPTVFSPSTGWATYATVEGAWAIGSVPAELFFARFSDVSGIKNLGKLFGFTGTGAAQLSSEDALDPDSQELRRRALSTLELLAVLVLAYIYMYIYICIYTIHTIYPERSDPSIIDPVDHGNFAFNYQGARGTNSPRTGRSAFAFLKALQGFSR